MAPVRPAWVSKAPPVLGQGFPAAWRPWLVTVQFRRCFQTLLFHASCGGTQECTEACVSPTGLPLWHRPDWQWSDWQWSDRYRLAWHQSDWLRSDQYGSDWHGSGWHGSDWHQSDRH